MFWFPLSAAVTFTELLGTEFLGPVREELAVIIDVNALMTFGATAALRDEGGFCR